MKKKQNFMNDMTKEKQIRRESLYKAKLEQKQKQEENRKKFQEQKTETQNKIAQTRQYMYLLNHVNHNEIKEQEKRNKQQILDDKIDMIKTNQNSFINVKT